MVWKQLDKTPTGTATQFGGEDTDKISKLFNGVSNVDTVDINSTFKIRHGKGQITSASNTNPITIESAASAARTFTFPDLTGTAATIAGAQTITDKTISAASNTLTGVTTPSTTDTFTNKTFDVLATGNSLLNVPLYPEKKIWGYYMAGLTGTTSSVNTFGMFLATRGAIPTGQGTITFTTGTAGRFNTFPTGTTLDQQAGVRFDNNAAGVIRNKNGRFKAKFRINHAFVSGASTYRFMCGLASQTSSYLTGNDPISTGTGIFLYLRSTDTNFVIGHRAAGTATYDTTSITPDTNIHTFELKAVGDTEWQWAYDGGSWTPVTTEIPTTVATVVPHCYIQTNESAVSKNFDLWWIVADQDP